MKKNQLMELLLIICYSTDPYNLKEIVCVNKRFINYTKDYAEEKDVEYSKAKYLQNLESSDSS